MTHIVTFMELLIFERKNMYINHVVVKYRIRI